MRTIYSDIRVIDWGTRYKVDYNTFKSHFTFPVRGYPGLGLLPGLPGLAFGGMMVLMMMMMVMMMVMMMPGLPGLAFGGSKRKKSWTRAVFSNLQRKGLEKR